MYTPSTRTLRTSSLGLALALAACGGGDNGLDSGGNSSALTVRAEAYRLNGSEPALDLSNPDAVLASALAAVVAGTNLDGNTLLGLDTGNTAPGAGQDDCDDGGSVNETVSNSSGNRNYRVEADQCYFRDNGNEFLLDGVVSVQSNVGAQTGNASLGSAAGGPLVALFRAAGESQYLFAQLAGDVSFSGTPLRSITSLARVISAVGSPPGRGTPFTPERGVEIRAGSSASGGQFVVEAGLSGAFPALSVFGPLSVEGVDLNPECVFRARFNVNTTVNFQVGEDELPRNGELQLTAASGAGTATVTFDGVGAARVTLPNGVPVSYTANQVASLCGF